MPCRDVSEVPYLRSSFYYSGVLLCDTVSMASWSILLGRLTLEGEGVTFRRNVGSHSRTITVSHPTEPAARMIEPHIVHVSTGYVKRYELVELMCIEVVVD
jgi:hypothetical protein